MINGVFLYVFNALATGGTIVVSCFVAAAVMPVMLLDEKRAISIAIRQIFSWDGRLPGKILSIAIPSGIESGMFQICRVVLTSVIGRCVGAGDYEQAT